MTTEPEPEEDTPIEELRYRTTPAAAAEIKELVAAVLGRIERGEQCRRCGRRQEPENPCRCVPGSPERALTDR